MTFEQFFQISGPGVEDINEATASLMEYTADANAESRQAALEAAHDWESKRELMEHYIMAQIEIARKRANLLIAAQGMHVQAMLARFANEKIADLNTTLNHGRERFLSDMEPQFENIEKFRHRPELYEPAYRSVNHQIQVFFEATDMLLNGFVESLARRVSEGRQ